jgi:arylsulfatase A-like enzyme
LDHVRCHGFYPPFLFDNGKIDAIEGNTHVNCAKNSEPESPASIAKRWNMEGKKTYSQDIFLQKILAFINEHKNDPFFLYHPTQLPHGPVSIPKIHPELENQKGLTSIEKEYGSMVKMLDEQIGIIWDELKRLGLEKNTIIMFASDNGHEIYYSEKGRCEKPYRNIETGKLFDDYTDKYYSDKAGDRFNGNAGMAGLKRSNLEGGVHIPLVFYWKGHLPAGAVRQDIVSMYDLVPTFANMLQVSLPVKKDGVSFYSLLTLNKKLASDRYIVFGSNLGPAIVTNQGWKLRYYHRANVYELYNLKDDPQERNNLIDKYPQIASDLKKILLKECGGNLSNGINRYG